MGEKWKLVSKFVAIVLVLVALGMKFGFVVIPGLNVYGFWILVLAFVALLVGSF